MFRNKCLLTVETQSITVMSCFIDWEVIVFGFSICDYNFKSFFRLNFEIEFDGKLENQNHVLTFWIWICWLPMFITLFMEDFHLSLMLTLHEPTYVEIFSCCIIINHQSSLPPPLLPFKILAINYDCIRDKP